MAWQKVVEQGKHHPSKGTQGFTSKPSNERVSKVLTIRLTEEQIDVIKSSLKDLPFNSMSDLTREDIYQYLLKHQVDMNGQGYISPNQTSLLDAFEK